MNTINSISDKKTDWIEIQSYQSQLLDELANGAPSQSVEETLDQMKSLVVELDALGQQDPNVNQPQFFKDISQYQNDIAVIEKDVGNKNFPQAIIDTENSSTLLMTISQDLHI